MRRPLAALREAWIFLPSVMGCGLRGFAQLGGDPRASMLSGPFPQRVVGDADDGGGLPAGDDLRPVHSRNLPEGDMGTQRPVPSAPAFTKTVATSCESCSYIQSRSKCYSMLLFSNFLKEIRYQNNGGT